MILLVLKIEQYVLNCVLKFIKMKPDINENAMSIPVFNIYLRVILGIAIISIGSYSLFHLIFTRSSLQNEQEIFLNGFFQTLFIGFGIWMITKRNKPMPRDFSKPRLYTSLIIMIGVILALAVFFFFFD